MLRPIHPQPISFEPTESQQGISLITPHSEKRRSCIYKQMIDVLIEWWRQWRRRHSIGLMEDRCNSTSKDMINFDPREVSRRPSRLIASFQLTSRTACSWSAASSSTGPSQQIPWREQPPSVKQACAGMFEAAIALASSLGGDILTPYCYRCQAGNVILISCEQTNPLLLLGVGKTGSARTSNDCLN
jgi:hypothetical protein